MANKGLLGGTGTLAGLGIGAGLMYFFDPQMGNRRRALLRDRLVSLSNDLNDGLTVAIRDATHRIQGLMAETRSLVSEDAPTKEQLQARVRSTMGRHVSHPSAIEVLVPEDGYVVLRGPILEHEIEDLLEAVSSVRGVCSIENRLEAHSSPGDVPALQGGTSRPGARREWMQTNWSPATRLFAGAIGTGLMLNCSRNFNFSNALLGTLGFGLFVRAAVNQEMGRMLGIAGGQRAVDFQKTITIAAPLDEVYRMWTHYEVFPRFMTNVRNIDDLGGGRSRWTVAGPLGTEVEWIAVVTKQIPNEIFAWKTEPGSPVAHSGIIHFQPTEDGSTRIHVRMSYAPPAGVAGHVVASLFGADPQTEMDQDLMRMKSFFETGNLPRDAAHPPQTGTQL